LSMNSVKKVNYMDFGGMYSDIFLRLLKQEQFSKNQIKGLKIDIYNQVKAMRPLLNILLDFEKLNSCSKSEFLNLFGSATKRAVVMKIAYFETILEYCFLFQNDSVARRMRDAGELSNSEVKTMIFKLNPDLFREFNLKHFNVSLNKIVEYLKSCSRQNIFVTDFSEEHFLNFFKWRFAHNVRFHFLKGHLNWDNSMSIDEFVRKNKSLAGQMILRSNKNPYDFETHFAKKFWRRMNGAKATILTYENLPKGEIGIIPSNNLKYEVYNTDLMKGKLNLTGKLDIVLVKKLVGTDHTIMRTHYGKN